MPPQLLALGAVIKPHGIRGEMRVYPYNADSDLLLQLDTVWLRSADHVREVAVEHAQRHGDVVRMKLRGIDTPEAVDALRKAELCIDREKLPPTGDDEVYHVDLIGLRAIQAGRELGTIVEVLTYPAADCLLLRTPEGDREVPFAAPYVGAIDRQAGTIEVDHLEDFEIVQGTSE